MSIQNIGEILNSELVANGMVKLTFECEYQLCGLIFNTKNDVFSCKNCKSIVCTQCIERSGKYCLNCMNDVHKCQFISIKYICGKCGIITCRKCTSYAGIFYISSTTKILCINCKK